MSLFNKNSPTTGPFPSLEKALAAGEQTPTTEAPKARIERLIGIVQTPRQYPVLPTDITKSIFPRRVRDVSKMMAYARPEEGIKISSREFLEVLLTGHFLFDFWAQKKMMHGSDAVDLAQRSLSHAPLSRYFTEWFDGVVSAFDGADMIRSALSAIEQMITASIESEDPYLFVNVDFLEIQASNAKYIVEELSVEQRLGFLQSIQSDIVFEVFQANRIRE